MAQDLNLNQRLIVTDTDGVRVTGITSGTYLEISGNLPGYAAGLYPTIKSGGTIHFAVNGAYSAYLEANDTYFGILDSSTVTRVLLRTNGSSYLTGGNVGIGTTSPDFTLDVEKDVDTWVSRIYNTGSDANAQALLVRSDATAAHDATVLGVYADSGYKMVVKSTGNVGIGTTSPAKKLVVAASSQTWGGAPQIAFYDTTSGQTGARNWTVGAISTSWGNFTIASSTAAGGDPTLARLTITNAGNVGIGTTSPDYPLEVESPEIYIAHFKTTANVNQVVGLEAPSGKNTNLYFYEGSTPKAGIRWDGANDKFILKVGNTATDALTITDAGNVGIGTTSPTHKFHLENGVAKFQGNTTTDGTIVLVAASSKGTNKSHIHYGSTGDWYIRSSSSSGKVVIQDSGGNVGIGTTSPNSKLHVYGGHIRVEGSATDQYYLEGTRTGVGTTIRIYDNANTAYIDSYNNMAFRANQNGGSGGSFRFTGGNLGIGTTSPEAELDVNGRIAIRSSNRLYFGHTTTLNSWTTAQYASSSTHIFNAQTFVFNNEGYGSTEYMRITSSGNVGIGTTSPQKKLDVRGGYFMTSDGSGKESAFVQGGTGYAYFGNLNAGPAAFGNSENWTTLVADGGNVGIGTTSPGSKLEVQGTIAATGGIVSQSTSYPSSANIWGISNDYPATAYGIRYVEGSPDEIRIIGNSITNHRFGMDVGNAYLAINSGNVGIGTTSPGAKLEVFGTGNTLRLDSAANGSKEILFRNVGTGTATIKTDGDLKLYVEDAGKNILFDTTGGEKMRITAAGNVGIGTTSPGYKLDVSGDIRATGDVISGGQQLVIPAVGRFLFDSTTDYNTATEGSIAISTEGAIQGGDNTVYTINERDITFNEGGFYKISVYITYTSTTQRANPGIRLKKNNTDYISPWGLSGYLRYASGHNEASNFVDTIAYFDENDYVEVYTKAFAASGTCTDDGSGSHILIERIAM